MLYTKEQLLKDYNLLVALFRFDHFSALYLIHNYNDHIKNSKFTVMQNDSDKFEITGMEFDKLLSDKSISKELLKTISSNYRNIAISESYEWLKMYCNNSTDNNKNKFLGKLPHKYIDTLNYLRVLRNCLNHFDGPYKIDWPGSMKNINSVTYGNRTISQGMKGNEVKINSKECLDLIKDIHTFCNTELE